ncbi:alpha/beta hydrolase fold domain-containing protein [Anditalea andensis]|uniref:Alpha/beta hydrolase fold-3 domain-containing protein n=1 Tax=Anditalea andensis TaxID=1048983 RepID=A0A074KWW5_9BACT|nr:alpha/beta hydrolase [Anditalea andensis]KEO72695.1 hypothetical protein EL17_18335 [Anditalea andensis]
MKKIILVLTVAMASLSSCAYRVKIAGPEQLVHMSQEAQDSLRSFKYYRFPLINLNDKQKLMAREQWNAYENWMLEDMHHRFGFTTRDTVIANVKVAIIQPNTIQPGRENIIGFHLHGGGFMMGTPYERAAMLMANEYGYTVYSVDYPLSPEVKYPVAIDASLEVYKALVHRFPEKQMVSSSISGGGQIIQSMLLKAQTENLRMPDANVLFTPALDLNFTGNDSYYFNDGRDVIALKNSADKLFKDLYLPAAANLNDPQVSPVFAEYKDDFPPTILATGTRDLFLSISVRTFWKLKEGGVPTELLVGEGGWHAYQYYPEILEAIAARKAVYQFLDKYLK